MSGSASTFPDPRTLLPVPLRASVWVIEQGDYSDYRVVGVYSSRANAEKVLACAGRAELNVLP